MLDGVICQMSETTTANSVEITNLLPDTEYTYEVFVDDIPWADGQRLDWNLHEVSEKFGLLPGGTYDNRFTTFPHVTRSAAVTFAVLGDFGTGVKKRSTSGNKQREVAAALEQEVDKGEIRFLITTGDNIYARRKIGPVALGITGDEDDDWFFTYYQPYRYVINRIPVFPSVGNHDSGQTEFENDDRDQVMDNFHIDQRFGIEALAGRASLRPGLFYRFRCGADVELIALDTSKASLLAGHRFFQYEEHLPFLEAAFPTEPGEPLWKIPFFHHPPFTVGPMHDPSKSVIEHLVLRYFAAANIRAVFSGHEHNFQYWLDNRGSSYFVTGGGGKVAVEKSKARYWSYSDKMLGVVAEATGWAGAAHFLRVTIDGNRMEVTPIDETGSMLRVHNVSGDVQPVPFVVSMD
jgi:tartrate-resistant acid phosphatase type 5